MNLLPTLYKQDSKGRIQQWTIEYTPGSFWTIEGLVGGKLTTSKPTTVQQKNVGKANETSLLEQAKSQSEAKWTKKVEAGYFEDIDDCGKGVDFFEPMLAHKYELEKENITFPCGSDYKLDGMRCIVDAKHGMMSRKGKPIYSAPHILEGVKDLLVKYPGLVLDGELYGHRDQIDFEKVMSLVKKQKPSPEELAESKKYVTLWLYDGGTPGQLGMAYEDRWYFLVQYVTAAGLIRNNENPTGPITLCPKIECRNQAELDAHQQKAIAEGYEGQIIRLYGRSYENKRSHYLIKRKEFLDSEFIIKDITEGNGSRSGIAGRACFEMPNGTTFDAGLRGTHEYCRELLMNKHKYIGLPATVRYQELTGALGVPRMPVMIGIRQGGE